MSPQHLNELSSQQQRDPFSSVSSPRLQQQQQNPPNVATSQPLFNNLMSTQYLPPSTVSSNQQQHLPLSSVPTSYSQQQQQLPPNVTSQSQSLFNGLMSPQHLPPSPVPSNQQQQHIPFSNAPGSYSQQTTSNASKLPPKVALVNPQGVSKLSIAPSPYANMYKKPKAPVSNVPGNSPWHRNTETNSSPFEKK
uniref:Uncharacterized protein n=1 Tax=Panagrolaimus sp. ES5 TaxID=591445 RepID=A0AC34FZH5_9BILA